VAYWRIIFQYLHGRTEENHVLSSRDSWLPGRESNLGPPEYEWNRSIATKEEVNNKEEQGKEEKEDENRIEMKTKAEEKNEYGKEGEESSGYQDPRTLHN
jgi:hypothetical protein